MTSATPPPVHPQPGSRRVRVCCPDHPQRVTGCTPCRVQGTRYQNLRRLDGAPRLIDALGTRRRLEGLARDGYPNPVLADHLGIKSQRNITYLRTHERVFAVTAERVAAMFDELAGTTGPSTITAARAEKRGWVPSLAWLNPDDPDETPDPGYKPGYIHVDDIEFLVTTGATWHALESRLNATRETLTTALRRADRPDLRERLDLATYGPAAPLSHYSIKQKRRAVA